MATPFRPQRVLVTGVSNPLGAEVARRLAPQVPLLFGCDVADPVSALEEMDFVHADTRLSVIGQLVSEFALRNELCGVTVLRLGLRVSEETNLARYLSLPVVPTFAGFDPRLQLLHEDDAADAIVRATVGDHPGAFNVAGDGVVLLSQAIDIMGGTAAPVLPPYARWFSRLGLRLLAGVDLPSHLADVLAYGSVM